THRCLGLPRFAIAAAAAGASATPALRARLPYPFTQDGEKCSPALKRKPGRRRYHSLMGKRGTIWRRLDAGDGRSRRATSPPQAPTLTASRFPTKPPASSTPPIVPPT